MPIKRLTVAAALVSLLFVAGSLQAKVTPTVKTPAPAVTHVAAKTHTAVKAQKTTKARVVAATHSSAATKTHAKAKSHVKAKTRSVASAHTKTHAHKSAKVHAVAKVAVAKVQSSVALASPVIGTEAGASLSPLSQEATFNVGPSASMLAAAPDALGQAEDAATPSTSESTANVTDLRKALIGLAMNLRDTRYVRGGRDPSTGFDCSGFVRYVFAHAIGMKLPTNSASQFLAGLKVDRADMKPGDLVFFQTGRKHHISHVGIYLSNGRFIHSPATGKTVQVSSLSESYWARHFAGAKRPTGIAAASDNG